MLAVKDRPGVISVAEMRKLFEGIVNQTPVIAKSAPLGIMEVNGQLSHYMNADTDTMWIGFALGLRCAERLAAGRDRD